MHTQQYSGASSSVNTTRAPAIAKLVEKHCGWVSGSTNGDVGCGKNHEPFTAFLHARGVTNIPYDPFHQTEAQQRRAICALTQHEPDTLTLSNVLNILKEGRDREQLIKSAHAHLRTGGRLYVTVYEGDKSGLARQTKDDTWQLNRRVKTYIPELARVFGSYNVAKLGPLLMATKR